MKILVIQQKMIGDVLTSSILFEALKKEYPNAQLHYLVSEHTTAVLKHNPYVDKMLHFDFKITKVIQFSKFLKEIKKERYDAVIDVYAKLGSAITCKFSKATIRVSFDKWYTKAFFTHVFKRSIESKTNAGPAIEKRLRLLSPLLKNTPVEIKPKIYLTPAEKTAAKDVLVSAGIKGDDLLLMVSVLGSTNYKTLPFSYLAEILDLIAAKTEAKFLFNYIPKQKEDALKIYNLCNIHTQEKIFLEVFGKDLRAFLSLASHCDALIGNEGGAVNMAKALNIPTFSIFSPGVPKENWSIYENGTTNVSVHLKDYRPELFEKYSKNDLKKKSHELYNYFQPLYFKEKLMTFININKK